MRAKVGAGLKGPQRMDEADGQAIHAPDSMERTDLERQQIPSPFAVHGSVPQRHLCRLSRSSSASGSAMSLRMSRSRSTSGSATRLFSV